MKKLYLFALTAGLILLLSGVAGAQSTGNVENGKRLFLRDGCWQCHGYSGQGGIAGSKIGATALNAQGFIRYVRRPTGAMPAFAEKVLSDQELTDIHAYMKTIPAPKAAKDIPLLNRLKNE